jgi:hypothetical protein
MGFKTSVFFCALLGNRRTQIKSQLVTVLLVLLDFGSFINPFGFTYDKSDRPFAPKKQLSTPNSPRSVLFFPAPGVARNARFPNGRGPVLRLGGQLQGHDTQRHEKTIYAVRRRTRHPRGSRHVDHYSHGYDRPPRMRTPPPFFSSSCFSLFPVAQPMYFHFRCSRRYDRSPGMLPDRVFLATRANSIC